eukprot:SAG22_NODE_154_length_17189_cov_38.210064_5_plen_190_part_00
MTTIRLPVLHQRWNGPRGQGAEAFKGLGDAYQGLPGHAGVANWADVGARPMATLRQFRQVPDNLTVAKKKALAAKRAKLIAALLDAPAAGPPPDLNHPRPADDGALGKLKEIVAAEKEFKKWDAWLKDCDGSAATGTTATAEEAAAKKAAAAKVKEEFLTDTGRMNNLIQQQRLDQLIAVAKKLEGIDV